MSLRTWLLAPLLALPIAACGTTVPGAGEAATSSGDGLGNGLTSSAGAALGAMGTSSPGGTTTRGVWSTIGNSQAGPTSTGGSAVGGRGTSTQDQGANASQANRIPVRVGVLYIDGAEAVATNLGISGLSTGDAMAQAKAIVTYLNAKGGLAGRPIQLCAGKMDAASAASNSEGAYAQACASLTEDSKVTYVVSYVNLSESKLACYAKRGVTVLDDQSAVADRAGAKYASVFGGPGELALGRAATELVDALYRRGWLTARSKVGTVVPDTSDGAEIETHYLLPALKAHGLTPVASIRSTGTDTANQNANVVKFRSAGVDRVIPMGLSPLFLMNTAESQGYRPAYAVNSGFGPGALLETAAPKGQLRNAAGIGWSKYLDIGSGTKPGAVSSNETLCFRLMRQAGQQSTSGTTQAFQVALCNVLMYLKSASDQYGVTPVLLDSVRSQGLRFLPADAFSIRMVPGRADGIAAYRDVVFDEGCSCFQYVSGNRPTR